MKAIKNTIGVALILLMMMRCGGNPQKDGPTATAEAFLIAVHNNEFGKAKALCTERSSKNLDFFESLSGLGAEPIVGDFEMLREEISGDYARVYYESVDGKEKFIRLKQTRGSWEVMASKNDLSTGGTTANQSRGDDPDPFTEPGKGKFSSSPADRFRDKREGKTAEQIADNFLTALMFSDFKGAKIYASQSTGDMLEFQSGIAALEESEGLREFEILDTEENGGFSYVTYQENGAKKEQVIKLGKDKNGNWEVIMTKSDLEAASE